MNFSPAFNPVFARQGTTIFTVMSALATEHKAVNLGQGFPDLDGPEAIRAAAAQVLMEGPNQYPPMQGLPELRRALSDHARHFYKLDYDWSDEVLVTSGGTEALTAAIMALVGPGDEVVLIEPAYDSYRPIIEAAGGVAKTVTLSPPAWRLTEEALAAAVTPRTKAVMINSPLNPIGRVFDKDEMAAIARVLAKSDAVAICDEVYEHLTYDGRPHIPLATLPGMRERTVRVGSAGKIFSLTGWKVGWLTGPRALISVIAKAHQFLTFTTSPALQLGIAHGLKHEMESAIALTKRLQDNRDLLTSGLKELGFAILPSEGTYFLTAGISNLTNEKDRAFCERLVREAGVALIPLSEFFSGPGRPDTYVRFAFCKQRNVIEEALARLKRHFQHD
ncbi:MAG TPA: aminotransferase [Rhizomicrobium sp.]|jgi:aspartate/methionine/tyrosine aminotransferase|nr:aminotransferase [Rhizomicrobium sp.]